MRQLQATQALIFIWSLLAISTNHKALVKALSWILIDTTTSLGGLIHMLTVDRAFCIVFIFFIYDDLPLEDVVHTQPFYITIGYSGY